METKTQAISKKELLKAIYELEKVRGKKVLVYVNGEKKSISKSVKNAYIKATKLLEKIEEQEKELFVSSIKEKKVIDDVVAVEKVVSAKSMDKMKFGAIAKLVAASLIFGTFISLPTKQVEKSNDVVFETVSVDIHHVDQKLLDEICFTGSITNDIEKQVSLAYTNNFACPKDWEEYIFESAEKYDIPAEVAYVIIDQESDGNWNLNGVISATNDYGVAQINICNHKKILKELGYTSDDLLNNPEKNIDAMFYLLKGVFDYYGYTKDDYDIMNICGTYNGWVNWKNSSWSVDYANSCVDRYNEKIADSGVKKLTYNSII